MESEIFNYSYLINNKKLEIKCKDTQKNTADFLMKIIDQAQLKYGILESGKTVQIGWCIYKVIKDNDIYKVYVCDLKNEPLKNITDDLSYALDIFLRQASILNKINEKSPKDTSYSDTMIISKKALSVTQRFMLRQENNGKDSGWYLGALDEEESDQKEDYIKIYTYQLIDICEKVIDLLQLPVGTLAIIDNDIIKSVVDENDHQII